jgi:hypothetical protein
LLNAVRPEVGDLDVVERKELPEEIGRRESETSVKETQEEHELAGAREWLYFVRRWHSPPFPLELGDDPRSHVWDQGFLGDLGFPPSFRRHQSMREWNGEKTKKNGRMRRSDKH